jgi:hypothetical protein
MKPQRMWINQPSTLQPHHNLHGKRCIAILEEGERFVRVCFTDGPIHSMMMDRVCLSASL